MTLYIVVGLIISAIWTSNIYIAEPFPKGPFVGYMGLYAVAVSLWPVICLGWIVIWMLNHGECK